MMHPNSLARSIHDLGLAGWFGGSLMGAVGLNGGAASPKDPTERSRSPQSQHTSSVVPLWSPATPDGSLPRRA